MLKYPQAEAFIAKTIQNTSDDCVLWPFGRYKTGYARIYRRRRSFLVSRIICEAKNGTPPTSKHECAHSCGNGNMGCIAPAHLRWATRTENEADKVMHETITRGAKNAASLLSERDVIEIYRRLQIGESQRLIAKDFDIHQTTVGSINSGRCWAWLTGR